jgi:signal transduction histidine kinase
VEEKSSWEYIRDFVIKGKNNYYAGITYLVCKDKTTIICDTSGFCVFNKNDQPEEIVLVLRDITKERTIAEELENKNLEMARINSELIRSNQELKRVNELKTKFLSIASHELKTPLTSIKGYSEILIDNMEDKVDKSVYRMIESIKRAADRLHDVINNMLDITRIEQKQLRLKPEKMDLKKTVEECIEELSQFTSERNIEFRCFIDDTLPEFYGDKMRMQQVFTNIFSNALKYSPDGSTIEVKINLDKKDRFHIVVIDHGIGIDKEEVEKIFTPFYEIASPTRHSTHSVKYMGGGTGLGLSIVKGIVERHGGIIWVESPGTKPNQFPGSEFHIFLPVKARIQWDDDETQIIKLNKIMEMPKKKYEEKVASDVKETILVIDDDPEAIEMTSMILQSSFEVLTAATGEEGLKMAYQYKPSLILLDHYLPGLDGCQICRILRSQEETKDIPVAFFSAATQDGEIEKSYASGADEFIVKPFSSQEMIDKITRLLTSKYEEDSD